MTDFTVIKGGRPDVDTLDYKFINAEVTDTRLMGVLGLHMQWEIRNRYEGWFKIIHQFFYYDVEELGLDSIRIYELYDDDAVKLAVKTCFGGLGASMRELSESEARYLVCEFVRDTKARGQSLPESIIYAQFILDNPPVLSEEEIERLNHKMCVPIKNDYGVINYYLMRGFGKDYYGQKLLRVKASPDEKYDDISLKKHATFLQNSIEKRYNNNDGLSYLSESLVESDGHYYIVTSEIKLAAGRVLWASKRNCFEISVVEASTILCRKEYCTCYRITVELEDFDVDFAAYSIGTTKTEHETGDMFMEFKPDNNHVENQVFKLYEDLKAIYYVSDYGELIVAAYTLEDIQEAENNIKKYLSAVTQEVVKMQFESSVLYDYALSGFTNFEEFLKSLE